MIIVARSQWGASGWRGQPYTVASSVRTEWMAHYHGGPPRVSVGAGVPREIEAIHLANGWSGVGYNFVVDQAGTVFEGRGWDLVGAHCPGHNRTGIGIYLAVGGAQRPTAAALASARAVYDEASHRTGRALRKTWHGANYPTECPGAHLRAWVRSGMPAPAIPPPMTGDDMPLTDKDYESIAERVWAAKFGTATGPVSAGARLANVETTVRAIALRPVVDVEKLAAAIVAGLPPQGEVTAAALADEIARRLEA